MYGYRRHSISLLTVVLSSVIISLSLREVASTGNRCPRYLPFTSEMVLFHNTTCFQFVSQEKYWHQARDYCLRNRGRLVKIDDPETNGFILERLDGLWWRNNGVWIGLHDIASEMNWQWTGIELHLNQPVLWTNWGRGHPGAFLHTYRDCVRMVRNDGWKWHETFCNSLQWQYRFICEYSASNPGHAVPMRERSLRGQSSRNIHHSIHDADMLTYSDSEIISSDSDPQMAAAVQSEDETVSNEGGHNSKLAVIAVSVVCVLGGTLSLVAIFMFCRRRRRSETRDHSDENCVGSKVKKFDDVTTTTTDPRSSFRPAAAVSNIYVEADAKGHVTSRLAAEVDRESYVQAGSDGLDEEDDDPVKTDDTSYDTLRDGNIYSEIPDGNGDGKYPEIFHIYETLEDVRK